MSNKDDLLTIVEQLEYMKRRVKSVGKNHIVTISHMEDIIDEVRKLEAKVHRNRGFAMFYRNKGLALIERNRKLEAVVKDIRLVEHLIVGAYYRDGEDVIARLKENLAALEDGK